MAQDIEKYLLEKLDKAIDKQRSSEHLNLLGRLAPFESEFRKLWNDLNSTQTPSQFTDENWFRVRRENLYYLNNVLTEWQMISKKPSSYSFPELYEAYENIKKSLQKIKKELKAEESRGKDESHHQPPNLPIFKTNKELTYRWSSRHGPRKVHGLEDKAMSMERELVLGSVCAIGVVGMAGIGKTTLCQTIFGRQIVKESFCPRIWVCLSKQPREDADNRKEIVVRILKSLGVEDEVIGASSDDLRREVIGASSDDLHREVIGASNDGLRRLIFLLRIQLTRKRYLIVLDDAWNDDKFFKNLTQREHLEENWGEELAYGLPKGCGGTVILSSRSGALAKKMIGEEASFQYLKPVADENCAEIFKDTVVGYDDDRKELPQHLKDLKGEVMKRCAGLPLAAKLLGQIAREHPPPLEKEKPPVTVSSGDGGGQEDKHDEFRGAGELRGDGDDDGEEAREKQEEIKASSPSL